MTQRLDRIPHAVLGMPVAWVLPAGPMGAVLRSPMACAVDAGIAAISGIATDKLFVAFP